jgi:uncharacterized repeat protein (TIGR03803 family)
VKKLILAVSVLLLAVTTPSTQAQTFKVLHEFDGGTDGAFPGGGLVEDANGNLYGMTTSGSVEGVVYKIDNTDHESILFNFQGVNNGVGTGTALIQDQAGNLYGIADEGPGGAGMVFKLSQTGEQTQLFIFEGGLHTSNPKSPSGGLLRDQSGNIFGTTLFGGHGACQFSCGSIFRLDTVGTLRVLHNFSGGSDGSLPFGPLVRDRAGNLYGVAQQGGDLNCTEFPKLGCGTVFKLGRNGVLTVLHTFAGGADGAAPSPGLVFDKAGNLFGTANLGGTSEKGTVFKIASDGTYSILHRFTGKDGANPNGSLALDPAGNLYGTTQLGGGPNLGTVFDLMPSGRLKLLHAFSGLEDGALPLAGVIRDAAGHLFGTAFKNFLVQQVQGGDAFEITP